MSVTTEHVCTVLPSGRLIGLSLSVCSYVICFQLPTQSCVVHMWSMIHNLSFDVVLFVFLLPFFRFSTSC